jgi:hypothetical protein
VNSVTVRQCCANRLREGVKTHPEYGIFPGMNSTTRSKRIIEKASLPAALYLVNAPKG